MKRTFISVLLTLTLCAVGATSGHENPSSRQNQSQQPETVGRKYHLEATTYTNVVSTITVAGRLLRTATDTMKYELSADVITLAISPDNAVTRKRFTVLESKQTVGEKSGPILPKGTVVEVFVEDGKNIYQVSNKPVADEVASALEELITLSTAPISDPEMLGTDRQRKVGETWTVNAGAIRRELDRIDAQGGVISGSGIFERGANNHLILKSSFEVKDVFMPISPEFDKDKGEMSVQYSRDTSSAEPDQSSIETYSAHIVRVGVAKRNKDVSFSIILDKTSRFETRQ